MNFLEQHMQYVLAYWVIGVAVLMYFLLSTQDLAFKFRNDFGWFLGTLIVVPVVGWLVWPVIGLFVVWDKFVRD